MTAPLRIAHMSDLHLEFEPPQQTSPAWRALMAAREAMAGHPHRGPDLTGLPGVDLVVMAGDIGLGTDGIAYADAVAAFADCPVVYVAGNHEYYNDDFDRLRQSLREAAWATDGRVLFLDRDWVRLWLRDNEVVVIGCTLWSDYALGGDAAAAMTLAQTQIGDHRHISRNQNWFTPEDALSEHRLSLAWLGDTLAHLSADRPKTRVLVVTHHAPCRAGLGKNRSAALQPAYGSDLASVIETWEPDWWLHGHSHHRHATTIGRTLVASAPRGYLKGLGDAERFRFAVIEADATPAPG